MRGTVEEISGGYSKAARFPATSCRNRSPAYPAGRTLMMPPLKPFAWIFFDRFPTAQFPNESQTEDDLIWPILTRLGWTESLRQQNLTPRGREDVPDGLLFKDNPAKRQANTFPQEWRRYEFGLAVIESKRWRRPPPPPARRPGKSIDIPHIVSVGDAAETEIDRVQLGSKIH